MKTEADIRARTIVIGQHIQSYLEMFKSGDISHDVYMSMTEPLEGRMDELCWVLGNNNETIFHREK